MFFLVMSTLHPFSVTQIQETDVPKLAHYADKEANPLYPVPVLMNAAELETFYYMLMPEPADPEEDLEESKEPVVGEGVTKHD